MDGIGTRAPKAPIAAAFNDLKRNSELVHVPVKGNCDRKMGERVTPCGGKRR